MRDATDAEIKWCKRMKRLMKEMPRSMYLVADGKISAVDRKEYENYDDMEKRHESFRPLNGTPVLGGCEGGDIWTG